MSLDDIVFPKVSKWPTAARRAFVVTLPVSAPLLILWSMFAVVVGVVAVIAVIAPAVLVACFWTDQLPEIRRWAQKMWAAHPKDPHHAD